MPELLRHVHLALDDETRDSLTTDILRRVEGCRLDSDRDSTILARIGRHVLRAHLPAETLRQLGGFRSSGAHALSVDNLPQEAAPSTPVEGFCDEARLPLTNALHFGLIDILGLTPFSVDYENQGRLIRNVVPNPESAGLTSSWGADAEFSWHTDNPHLPFGSEGEDPRQFPPAYLTFVAVRNHERVPTELMAVDDAVSLLPGDVVNTLSSPRYVIAAPDSNDTAAGGERMQLAHAAVLEPHEDGHRVRFDKGTTQAESADAEHALDQWHKALASATSVAPVLTSGQFLIFDNYRVVHRRGAFEPTAQASARWLRRCYAS